MRNDWQDNKEDIEIELTFYSLIKYVKTLIIRNNPKALKDLADYAVGKYVIGGSLWDLQRLSKNIKIVIENSEDAFIHLLRISKYFESVTVDGK